jgi:putative CocE/NonD family hydrolase
MSGTYRYRAEIERAATPIFGWASWLDAGTSQGLVNRFMNWSNPQIVVVGPWSHGGGNHASPFRPADTPTEPPSPVQSEQAACFFDQYLRGKANGFSGKLMIYYTLGEEKWKTTAAWPVKGTKMNRFYFSAGHKLAPNRPTGEGSDEYPVDFEVSTGTHNRWYTQLGGQDVVYEERSGQDGRMLTYTSEPLTKELEVTGQALVNLSVATTATDGNFIVYLEDISPDGKSTYIAEGMLRGLHRKISTEAPPYRTTYPYHSFKKQDGAPMVPGQRTTLTFQLIPTSVLFRAGHRIRIAVAGADKDTFQRTPAEGDVTITVDRSGGSGSFIDLPVVPRK